MSSENNDNETKDQNSVNEPESSYIKPRIRFFGSFEEMNEADAAEMARMEGVQHLANATAMIKKIYAKELLKQPKKYKLHFK
jgi:hypothetical protein